MSETIEKLPESLNNIMTNLKELTLLEATTLVKHMEEVFEIDASPTMGFAAAPTRDSEAAEEKTEEKTTFDVTVEDVASDKRVAVLKVIRKLTSLGLADAKAFTTDLPKALKEGVSKDEADEAKTALEEAGAKVTIA